MLNMFEGSMNEEVMNQLKNPKAAREAFILSEILGSPRVHKRF